MNNAAKPNPLIELSITLIIPSIILMKLSGSEYLGTVNALLLALAFPLVWGARSLLRESKVNALAVLGLVSILLTGGIGVLKLDTYWLAVKEAAIPGLIGLVVVISAFTNKPLVRVLLFNPALMNVELIQEHLHQRGNAVAFKARLKVSTWMFDSCVLLSVAYYSRACRVETDGSDQALNLDPLTSRRATSCRAEQPLTIRRMHQRITAASARTHPSPSIHACKRRSARGKLGGR